ncbi:hypothetical protein M2409_002770 [Sphingobacterium sp. JUb21]|nr:hypothetical protein [Sphingobacterium sp. JUb21]
MKFGEYPVNHSTGLPEISIPLISINLKEYQLPIAAKYHASGRKVDLNFSEIGLNWQLDAYGLITREIKGISDLKPQRSADAMEENIDYFNPISSDAQYTRGEKFERRLQLAGENPYRNTLDTEYDIYHINFKNISTSFVIRTNGSITFLNYFPYKVTYQNNIFSIIDQDGVSYTFGSIVESNLTFGAAQHYQGTNDGIMSWYLAKIETPNKEYIRFKYGNVKTSDNSSLAGNLSYGTTATLRDYWYEYGVNQTNSSPQPNSEYVLKISNTIKNDFAFVYYVSSIDFSNGSAEFIYNTNNYSLSEINLKSIQNHNISSIKIFYKDVIGKNFTVPNNQGISIKEIAFFGDNLNNYPERFLFDYYSGNANGNSLLEYCYGKDYWGYANTNVNSNLIPINKISHFQYPYNVSNYVSLGSDIRRQPDFSQKVIGMLKRIEYPSRGFSDFTYEANVYNHYGTNKYGPGLRIKTINNSDGTNHFVKEYKYGYTENGVGSLLWLPQESDYMVSFLVSEIPSPNGILMYANQSATITEAKRYRYREFFSEPKGYINIGYRQPVYYGQVTEYIKDVADNNLGKTVYSYSLPLYEIRNEYFSDNRTNETYNFDTFIPNFYSTSLLLNKTDYIKSSNIYQPVKSVSNEYIGLKRELIPQITYYRRQRIVTSDSQYQKYVEELVEGGSTNDSDWRLPWNSVRAFNYNLESGASRLDSISEIQFNLDNNIVKRTKFNYNSSYVISPSSVKFYNSDGSVDLTNYYYPDDINSLVLIGGNLEPQELEGIKKLNKANHHQVETPIQIVSYSSNLLKNLERNTFKLFSNRPLPFRKYISNYNFPIYKLMEILSYDNLGNPREVKSLDGAIKVYIWGYNHQYPILEITNATYSEILIVLTQAEIDNLNNPNHTEAVMETLIKNAATKLRNHVNLSKAMVTNYTYKPLVGMTSKSDARGVTEYYQYDGMQRLKAVLDQFKDVTRAMDYHYRAN